MTKEIRIASFVYPGCITVCNASAKFINGNLPEIARIGHDRSIEWCRKRITEQMRRYIEELSREPFIAISASQNVNFFEQ